MHLVGRLSNPCVVLEAVLVRVPDAPGRAQRELVAAPPKARRLGNGVVQRAVIRALAVAGRPMDVCEAQTAVEALLGHGVSRDSVNSCLSTGACRVQPCFRRVAPGRYRLIRDP
jgi:hypothetical protein